MKTTGFGSIVGFIKGSSLSSQLPFDIMLLLDKDESPECHSLPFIPVTIVFLCSLP